MDYTTTKKTLDFIQREYSNGELVIELPNEIIDAVIETLKKEKSVIFENLVKISTKETKRTGYDFKNKRKIDSITKSSKTIISFVSRRMKLRVKDKVLT